MLALQLLLLHFRHWHTETVQFLGLIEASSFGDPGPGAPFALL